MKADQLIRYFERIAEAPDAVSRLRKFVLDLAVRGKLVEQDPGDESITHLLERVDRERISTAATDRRAIPELQELLAKDSCWQIPSTWTWRGFADLALFIDYRGKTPTKTSSGIRLITAKNIRRGLINKEPEEFISEATYSTWMTRGLPKVGDILFTTEAPIGNAAVVDIDEKFALAQRTICLCPFGGLNPAFLTLQILSPLFQSILQGVATGLTAKGIKAAKLEKLPLAVPPLAEQHRIVTKVDELMALCDDLEAAQAKRETQRDHLVAATLHHLNNGDSAPTSFEETARFYFNHLPRLTTRPEHVEQLRQTILNLAIQGKLVPQDSDDEPACALLKRIRIEKGIYVQRSELRHKNPTEIERGPFELPHGWKWSRVQDLFLSVADGDHQPPPKAEAGIPFLVIGNIRNGFLNFSDCRYVSEPYYVSLGSTRRPLKGDILYTLVGSYGIPVLIQDERPFCIQRHIGILRPSGELNASFLKQALQSKFVFEQATQYATGIAQKTVPLSGLRRILIPLPPLAEQHRIVAKVDELMTVCDELEQRLIAVTDTRRTLLEATIHEALSMEATLSPIGENYTIGT